MTQKENHHGNEAEPSSIEKYLRTLMAINIYHKGCGTMGVPMFASENIELTFAFNLKKYQLKNTLGAETFARGKIREIFAFREHKLSRIGQNIIFRVLNFREWTEKLIFFVVLRKSLDPDRNKRERKNLIISSLCRIRPRFRAPNIFLTLK